MQKNQNFNFFLFSLLIFSLYSCTEDLNLEENIYYNVSISIEGQGSVSTLEGSYQKNDTILFEAISNTGYYFDRWEGFDSDIKNETYQHVLKGNISIRAYFLPIPEVSDNIKLFIPKEIDPNPIFIIENGGSSAYLTSKTGEYLKTWNFDSKLGNDLELLSDGSMIGLFKPDQVSFSFGGYGGILKKFNPLGSLDWEYEINNENELAHHDFEIMPNGNILILVWERFSESQAIEMGFNGSQDIFLEKIIEFSPQESSIVWEWKSSDHLIQDFNPTGLNYGIVSEHPEKIDLNYYDYENGDLMHANGLYYDDIKDVIYVSVNFYSEIWVVPHKYDTDTTKTDFGDLSFRFGNPRTYKGEGERLFFNNHHPSLVTLDNKTLNHFLIYMNGTKEKQSIVYEFELPSEFDINPLNWKTPNIYWSYSNPQIYNAKISGVYRLPNGNTLICEGDFGYWEVTKDSKVVWKYEGNGTFWRGYVYPNMQ